MEYAAFSGYCTAMAYAVLMKDGLTGFDDFYHRPGQENANPKPTTEDHIQMMRERGEDGPP
jgi:hypothetical protein